MELLRGVELLSGMELLRPVKGTSFSSVIQVDEKAAVLKGHDFIRAASPAISDRLYPPRDAFNLCQQSGYELQLVNPTFKRAAGIGP